MGEAARPWRIAALVALVIVTVVAAIVGVALASPPGGAGSASPPTPTAAGTATPAPSPATTRPSAAPAPTATPGQVPYDVVAILGQSNAQGAGYPSNPALDVGADGLDQLAGSRPAAGTIIPAVDSLYQVTQWKSPTGTPRVGPGMQFGRDLLKSETTGRHVLLVPAAEGDTSMTGDADYSWNPADTRAATNLYKRALTQIDRALAQNPQNRLVAIIWAQGESDAALTTGASYQSKLLTLVDGLRAHYGAVPFLIGGMVPEWVQGDADRQSISEALQAIPALRSGSRYVAGVPGKNQDAGLHYSASGARAMGDRYFAAYEELTL